MTDMAENMKAAMDLIYLVSCAVNEEKTDASTCAAMNLDEVYAVAERHSLRSTAAVALEQVMTLPRNFLDGKFKAIRRQSLFDIERSLVLKAFEENGIWYLPLKGILLKDYYPKTFMREMLDNDILCDYTKMERVKELMEGLGYTCKTFGITHDDEYDKAGMLEFEIHRSLFNQKYYPELYAYFENIKSRLIKDGNNKYGYHMTDEDFYIFLVCHLYKHYVYDGTGLRSLLDLYVFNRRFDGKLNGKYLNAEFGKLKLTDFERDMRQFAQHIFTGQELSESEIKELEYFISSDTMGSYDNSLRRQLNNDDSAKSKRKYVLKRLFPSFESLKTAHPVVYKYKVLYPFWIPYRSVKRILSKRERTMYEIKQLKEIKSNQNRGKYNQ